jgi:hypothetical protein
MWGKGMGTYFRAEGAHGAGRLFLADSHAFVVRVGIGENVAFLCCKSCTGPVGEPQL